MNVNAEYLICAIVALATAGVVFLAWLATRKRIAADTVGRAQEHAQRLTHDAERDAETRRKEILLDAKEKAHEIVTEACYAIAPDVPEVEVMSDLMSRGPASIERRF